jgi:hypothetical protein
MSKDNPSFLPFRDLGQGFLKSTRWDVGDEDKPMISEDSINGGINNGDRLIFQVLEGGKAVFAGKKLGIILEVVVAYEDIGGS